MLQLKIEQDTDAIDPRKNFDNYTKMYCVHSRYNLGDVYASSMPRLEEKTGKHINQIKEEADWWLPLYLLDHSGITMSTGSFNDPWDSGQVGIITITKAQLEAIGLGVTEENAKKVMEQEVEEYDMYLRGDVWCYSITDTATGQVVDSCCGMYGHDYCEKEANEALQRLTERHQHMMPHLAHVEILIPAFGEEGAADAIQALMTGLVERDAILDWRYNHNPQRHLPGEYDTPKLVRFGTFKKVGEE